MVYDDWMSDSSAHSSRYFYFLTMADYNWCYNKETNTYNRNTKCKVLGYSNLKRKIYISSVFIMEALNDNPNPYHLLLRHHIGDIYFHMDSR